MPPRILDKDWVSKDRYYVDEAGCWVWLKGLQKDGYGSCSRGAETLAHRAFYKILVGPIPEDKEIDHLCRNRACVNPSHMEVVSHAENVARADYKTNHRNRVKTHCIRGHKYTEDNTLYEYYGDRKQRKCRLCRAEQQRKRSKK